MTKIYNCTHTHDKVPDPAPIFVHSLLCCEHLLSIFKFLLLVPLILFANFKFIISNSGLESIALDESDS